MPPRAQADAPALTQGTGKQTTGKQTIGKQVTGTGEGQSAVQSGGQNTAQEAVQGTALATTQVPAQTPAPELSTAPAALSAPELAAVPQMAATGATTGTTTGATSEVPAEVDPQPARPAQPLSALPVPDKDAQPPEATAGAVQPVTPQAMATAPLGADQPQLDMQAEPPAETAGLPEDEREEIVLTVPRVMEPAELPEVALQELPRAEPAPRAQGATVAIGTPARRLGEGSSSRLPKMGDTAEVPASPEDSPSGESTTEAKAALPPLQRFAAPFESQEGTPKMAIVLIDDGSSDIGVEALSSFPYPLSIALDSGWAGASEAMARYRAAGFEVLAMVNLPAGARASDVEVSLPVVLDKLPQAVALMETPDAGMQASREVIAQVSAYARESGHGLLLFPKGLNTAQKLAAKAGVPSATVFRDFDKNGQNASAIKRFLGHAGLKAGAEGGVVMLGRLRADTISALLLWGLQERGDRLQLAPVSALLTAQP